MNNVSLVGRNEIKNFITTHSSRNDDDGTAIEIQVAIKALQGIKRNAEIKAFIATRNVLVNTSAVATFFCVISPVPGGLILASLGGSLVGLFMALENNGTLPNYSTRQKEISEKASEYIDLLRG